MNILILSAGTRNKVVQYFKKALNEKGGGLVYATDCSREAPAIYEADRHIIVPRIDEPDYMDTILDICSREKIDGVLSLIDPELSLLAHYRRDLEEIGTVPVISSEEAVENSFNKLSMDKVFTSFGLKSAGCCPTIEDFMKKRKNGEMDFPVFVKPICGSASMHINLASNEGEIRGLYSMYDNLMIQEYMTGDEYGADVYIDMISGRCTSIFLKKKLKMRAGETDKAVSVKDVDLFDAISDFAPKAGFRGIIDIDIFKRGNEYIFSEINPRFGGGYPHAYECGVDVPGQIINNIYGKENPVTIGNYEEGITMMKYCEVMIRRL